MSGGRPARWRWDLALAAFLAVLFALAVYESGGFGDAQLFPLGIALPSLALALLQVAISLRQREASVDEEPGRLVVGQAVEVEGEEELPTDVRVRRTAQIAAWIVGIFALVWLIGFQVAIPLAAIAYLRFATREPWVPALGVTAICFLLVWGVFDRLLHVPLPPGVLVRALGIA
jgi:hypothetical protein